VKAQPSLKLRVSSPTRHHLTMDPVDQFIYESDPSSLSNIDQIEDHLRRLNRDLNCLVLSSMEHTLEGIEEWFSSLRDNDAQYENVAADANDRVRFCCNYALVALVDRLYVGMKSLAEDTHARLVQYPNDDDPALLSLVGATERALRLLYIEPRINLKEDLSDSQVRDAKERLRGARDARNLIVHNEGRLASEGWDPTECIPIEGQEPQVKPNGSASDAKKKGRSERDIERYLPECIDRHDQTVAASPELVRELALDAETYFEWLTNQFRDCWRIAAYLRARKSRGGT